MDEVKAITGGAKVNVLIRPNSHNLVAIADKLKYRAQITGGSAGTGSATGQFRFNKTKNVFMNIFLGTLPNSVYFKDGIISSLGVCAGIKYLQSDYVTDSNGSRNVVTVLFPEDESHLNPSMERINGDGYSGAEISHNAFIKDYAIESSSTSAVTYDGASFHGLASMYRINNNENEFYFVRQGKEFNDGKTNKKGFISDNDISIYMKDKTGKIIVPHDGANVTFYYPGIIGIKIDGITKGINVNIAEGNHEVEIFNSTTDTTPPAAPTNVSVQ